MGEVAMYSKAKKREDNEEEDYYVSKNEKDGMRYYIVPWKDVKTVKMLKRLKLNKLDKINSRSLKSLDFENSDALEYNKDSQVINYIHDYERLILEETDEKRRERLFKNWERYEDLKERRQAVRLKNKYGGSFRRITEEEEISKSVLDGRRKGGIKRRKIGGF